MALAPTPAPAVAAPSALKTAPIVKAPAVASSGPDPVVSSPAAISKGIDSAWGTGGGDGATASTTGASGGGAGAVFNLDTYKARVRQIEDPSGDPNATSPAGAHGLYQFMPSTRDKYGGEGDQAMDALTADNMAAMRAGLGRDPTPGELYLAHQQGAAGALKLLSNPDQPAAAIVGRAAVTGNGGTADMTAGQFANMWVSKFGANAPSPDAQEAGQSGSVDPNAIVAPVVGGNKYFTAKDYANPNSSKREFFNALMYGGFAMMGGESRNPWVNVGRGEMAGMDYYQKQQGLDRDWISKQAEIDHLSADNRRADANVNLRNQQMQIEAMKIKYALDNANARSDIDKKYDTPSGGAPTPAPSSATTTAPAAAPPSAAAAIGAPGEGTSPVNITGPAGPATYPALGPSPAAAATTGAPPRAAAAASPDVASAAAQPVSNVGPDGKPTANWWNENVSKEDNPNYWLDFASSDNRKAVFDPNAATRAQEERRIASELSTKTTVRGKDGTVLTVPGSQEAAARGAGLTAQAEEQGKFAATPIEPYVFQNGQWVKMRVQDPADIAEVTQRGTLHGMPTNMAEPPALAGATKGAETSAEQRALTDPAIAAAQAAKEGEIARAKAISEGGAKQLVNADAENAQAGYSNKIHEQRLVALQQIMQRWEPGAWSEHIADIKNILNTFGVKVANTAEAFEFLKNTTGEVFDRTQDAEGRCPQHGDHGAAEGQPFNRASGRGGPASHLANAGHRSRARGLHQGVRRLAREPGGTVGHQSERLHRQVERRPEPLHRPLRQRHPAELPL